MKKLFLLICCLLGAIGVSTAQSSDYYVVFDNTANWGEPHVWAWVEGGDNCNDAETWPGDPMTRRGDGKWYWELPAGKPVPTKIIFNNNNQGLQTNNLDFVNGATYKPDGSHEGGYIPPVSSLEPTGTLPVLYINVYTDATKSELENEIIDKDLAHKNYFSNAEYWIDMKDCQWLKDLGATEIGSQDAPLPLEIKARGNFTRKGYSKKPFKLKLGSKQNLLNMNVNGTKSKHWAILAHADDSFGYMRNFTGFRLGEMIGLPWTPRQQPIEVVINGDYRGIYFLTESIRVGDGRLPITELDDNVSDPALISGGYLVELDNYIDDCAFHLPDASNRNPDPNYGSLMVTPDTPEELSDLQLRFLKDQFTKMNDLVNSGDDSELWSYLELDDAARYYVVEEILSHYEAYHGSTYLMRDHGEGQKWHFTPLWDCGHAFDGPTNQFFPDMTSYNGQNSYGNNWIGNNYGSGLRGKTKFMNKVKDTFQWFVNKEADGSASPYERLCMEIDEYVNHVQAAALRDAERWRGQPLPNQIGNDVPRSVVDNSDIVSDKDNVKTFLNNKINWLKGQWGSTKLDEPERDNTPAAPLPDYAKPGYEPEPEPEGTHIYVINDANWPSVSIYIYDEKLNNGWPGQELEFNDKVIVNGVTGVYDFIVPEQYANGNVIFSIKGENQYPGSGQPGLQLTGKDMVYYISNHAWAEPESVEFIEEETPWSKTLPLVRITTPNADDVIGYGDDGAVKKATFQLDALNLPDVTAIDATAAGDVTIKGRGKTYWDSFEKKAYKLKFKNKVAVLDMPKSKHWVLMPYSNDAANGLLSNFVGHEISRLIGLEWTAAMQPVELVINDEYMGLYFIAENVRAAADRVQIADYGDDTYSEENDFLLEFSTAHVDDGTELFHSWTSDNGFENKLITATPAKEDIATADEVDRIMGYLKDHTDNLNSTVAYAAANPMSAAWTDVIDYEQAAKYYIVQELMDDASAFADNFYMHHTTDSKWILGPVWDFGNAFASRSNKENLIHERDDFNGSFIKELYKNRQFIWYTCATFIKFTNGQQSRNYAKAKAATQESYNPTTNGSIDEVNGSIDDMVAKIQDAAAADAARWPQYAATSDDSSLADRAQQVKNYLAANKAYLLADVNDGGAGWSDDGIITSVDGILTDGDLDVAPEYFDVMGRRVTNPQPGSVYIVRRGATVTKAIVK
ncbi:MAG: starch-binding protein [Barnesiella sp.]|nr:starch-binding protein [Barnesiella sp.]MBD5257660.1 starch-binding protein [Barnesiella sp.]